jgi:hypothetical protein
MEYDSEIATAVEAPITHTLSGAHNDLPRIHTPLNGISLACSGRGMGYKSFGCNLFGLN